MVPLGSKASAQATHVLYDGAAHGSKPICFMGSKSIPLDSWNYKTVMVRGDARKAPEWHIPLMDVKGIVLENMKK